MPNIIISGDIGFDVTPQYIREQLALYKGKDIDIHIASPGGFVYEGIEIYNLIRDFKRENPESQVMIILKGQAMSIAAYISSVEGADMVIVEDNAVYMIHNAWSLVIGDYRELNKTANVLKGLSELMAKSFARRAHKSLNEIVKMLDDETYLFGSEIVEAGFADDIIKADDSSKGRESLILEAKVKWDALKSKMQKENLNQNLAKASVLIPKNTSVSNAFNIPAIGGNNPEAIMDRKELQAKHPDLYAEVEQAGKEKGLTEGKTEGMEIERARVSKLMEMKKDEQYSQIPPVVEAIEKAIIEGKTYEEAQPLVMAVLANKNTQAALESPDAITTGTEGATGSGENPEKPKNKTIKEV